MYMFGFLIYGGGGKIYFYGVGARSRLFYSWGTSSNGGGNTFVRCTHSYGGGGGGGGDVTPRVPWIILKIVSLVPTNKITNTHFHRIIQYALKRGVILLQYPLCLTSTISTLFDISLMAMQNYRKILTTLVVDAIKHNLTLYISYHIF